MELKKLTRPAFKKWLESKEPLSRVGRRGDFLACPIARFINETMGYNDSDNVAVLPTKILISDMNYETPYWGMIFISIVDNATDRKNITAQFALKALENTYVINRPSGEK